MDDINLCAVIPNYLLIINVESFIVSLEITRVNTIFKLETEHNTYNKQFFI